MRVAVVIVVVVLFGVLMVLLMVKVVDMVRWVMLMVLMLLLVDEVGHAARLPGYDHLAGLHYVVVIVVRAAVVIVVVAVVAVAAVLGLEVGKDPVDVDHAGESLEQIGGAEVADVGRHVGEAAGASSGTARG